MMADKEKLVELLHVSVCDYNCEHCEYSYSDEACIAFLEQMAADHLIANGVTVQKQGQWIVLGQRTYGSGRSYTHYCSECGQHGFDDYKRCPNCGAIMDLEE